jgi:xylan 1,4-beta-xylosidase
VAVAGDTVVARARAGPFRSVLGEAPRPSDAVVLVVETRPHAHGPDCVRLGFVDDTGEPRMLAELDGRFLSTEVAGGFTGRVIGMYAVRGDAAFDWFEYQEHQPVGSAPTTV